MQTDESNLIDTLGDLGNIGVFLGVVYFIISNFLNSDFFKDISSFLRQKSQKRQEIVEKVINAVIDNKNDAQVVQEKLDKMENKLDELLGSKK